MEHTTTLLLKHGIQGLISENEEFFKKNITQALALKLHESVAEIKTDVAKSLLDKQYVTRPSTEITEFVEFLNKFQGGTYKFKNGSSINITESEIQLLKQLFESLNPNNRQKMVSEILTDGAAFKQHIEFSQKAKRLI
jgi:hypothetical protein